MQSRDDQKQQNTISKYLIRLRRCRFRDAQSKFSPIFCRVSPSDECTETKKSKADRNRSAKVTLGREFSRQNSSPDPLEPWSTKDLANMNKLLDS